MQACEQDHEVQYNTNTMMLQAMNPFEEMFEARHQVKNQEEIEVEKDEITTPTVELHQSTRPGFRFFLVMFFGSEQKSEKGSFNSRETWCVANGNLRKG